MAWYDEGSSFIKLPMNSEITVTIQKTEKITDNPQFDLKNKDGVSSGFHYELTTEKGVLTIASWKLFYALKSAKADIGDTVLIKHGGKGEYSVEKTTQESPF